MVCRDDVVVSLRDRQSSSQALPLLGEEESQATPEHPVELLVSPGCDTEQDHLRDSIRMGFGVGERQCASP
jgi:hypothetical protein